MSEIQILTLVASLLGLVGTVFNLVTFMREKDRGHKKASALTLVVLGLLLGLVLMPRYAPQFTRRCLASLPPDMARHLSWWATPAAPDQTQTVPVSPMQASFTIEIQRNLLGGIGALMCNQRFSNVDRQPVRVLGFRISIASHQNQPARSYARVLPDPLVVAGQSTLEHSLELDPEIRDLWYSWYTTDERERGAIQMRWQIQDAQGRLLESESSNG